MDYSAFAAKELARTFRVLKSFVKQGVLTRRTAATYTFGETSNLTETTVATTIDVIVLSRKKKKIEKNILTLELLMRFAEVNDINLYDKLQLEGFSWTIGTPTFSDGLLVVSEVSREV